jgi:integrase
MVSMNCTIRHLLIPNCYLAKGVGNMSRLTDSRVAAIKPPTSGQDEHGDDLVTGLRLRVGKTGRKTWIVRTRAGAKQLNKTLGTYPTIGLGDAREQAKAFLLKVATDGPPVKAHTFGELADEWLKKVAKPNNRSWRLQERRLEIYVLPHWKDRELPTIRRADVRDLVEAITGDVTPNRVLTLIKTLFRFAMKRDWIEASPAEGVDKPNTEQSRDRVLSMEEVAAVYRAAGLLGYPFGGMVKLLCLTAQRRTEVASMRWADLDLKNATWTIPADRAKSGRAHLVPLSASAVEEVKATPKLGDFVWTTDGENHATGYSSMKDRLDKFIELADAKMADWTLHDIRRTVATHMVRLGVNETVVGRVLNHAVQGVTARVYALHSYAAEKRDALDRWEAELLQKFTEEQPVKVVKLHG